MPRQGGVLIGIPDLSVPEDEASELRVSGWAACLEMPLPEGTGTIYHPSTLRFLGRQLEGRTPMFWTEDGSLCGTFAVNDNTARSFDLAATFARAVGEMLGVGPQQVRIRLASV